MSTPAVAAVPPPLVVPPVLSPSLQDQDKANFLATLFSQAGLAPYASYFILHEFSNDDFNNSVGYALGSPDSDVLFQRYYQWNSQAQLYLHSISAMETSALPIFSGRAQPYQVFVSLDKISSGGGPAKILVPYQTAKLLSGAFIHGLVTRLILDRYKNAWLKATTPVPLWADLPLMPAPPKGPNPHPVATAMDAGGWAQKYLSTLATNIIVPKTWTAMSSLLNANHLASDYFGCLNYLSDSSQQTCGIILGWLAGDVITDPGFDPKAAVACQTAIWTLLNNRYTFVEIGKMVGYTFNYLNGFISSERTLAAISANAVQAPDNDPIKGAGQIYNNLSSHVAGVAQTDMTPLATAFFNFIVGEFYAISGSNAQSAAKYFGFIEGFAQGLIIAADVLYRQLYNEAYLLGYTNGFRDGYAQGYSAGWTEGYAVGYQAGQNTWMSGLQNIIGGASSLLNDAKTIDSLLKDVGTVGTVIAALF
jgi:hypothetical protein